MLKSNKRHNLGEFFMVEKDKCIGCGACMQLCPVGAISFDEDGKAKIDPNICIKCGTCEASCPVQAIKINY